MKKSVARKKLALNRETIGALEISQVVGGGVSERYGSCASCEYTCVSCQFTCYVTDNCNHISSLCTTP
jgi:hypothetical protein